MKKEKAMGFEIKCTDNAIRRHLNAKLSEEGFDEVTIMHGWILGYLYRNREREIFQKDIENEFDIARSTVTNILKLMEKKGYVTRTMDEKDARYKKLELTEHGMQVQQKIIKIIDKVHSEMEMGITTEEKEVFFRVVKKMRENMLCNQENSSSCEKLENKQE